MLSREHLVVIAGGMELNALCKKVVEEGEYLIFEF